MSQTRQAAVAGTFYPSDSDELAGTIQDYIAASATDGPPPKAMIVPHAGYIYSGPVAARGYARLKKASKTISRVVLLGPSHRVPFRGMALPSADSFTTPLGSIPVDRAACEEIRGLSQVSTNDEAHLLEHSLEVHLPFLQSVLGSFTIVPVVVGTASPEDVAEVLEKLWGDDETLVVISSDLSHYHDYDTAVALDRSTTRRIEELDYEHLEYEQACGRNAVRGLLLYARQHGLGIETLDLRNSGDTAGPRDRVVGYGTYIIPAA